MECPHTTLLTLPHFTFNLKVNQPLLVWHSEISIKLQILLNWEISRLPFFLVFCSSKPEMKASSTSCLLCSVPIPVWWWQGYVQPRAVVLMLTSYQQKWQREMRASAFGTAEKLLLGEILAHLVWEKSVCCRRGHHDMKVSEEVRAIAVWASYRSRLPSAPTLLNSFPPKHWCWWSLDEELCSQDDNKAGKITWKHPIRLQVFFQSGRLIWDSKTLPRTEFCCFLWCFKIVYAVCQFLWFQAYKYLNAKSLEQSWLYAFVKMKVIWVRLVRAACYLGCMKGLTSCYSQWSSFSDPKKHKNCSLNSCYISLTWYTQCCCILPKHGKKEENLWVTLHLQWACSPLKEQKVCRLLSDNTWDPGASHSLAHLSGKLRCFLYLRWI